ncbi:MAG: polymer-forming cytoskeletal protein [Spirochaetes bacterium]|nr:polymer-forming cytoskeletal protein [Spirochaetota bacterium]
MASKNEGMNSTIGEGSVFEGKFYISGSLRIDGKFEGEIKTDEELVVGETGKVKTDIVAKSVVIAGTVIGNISARNEVRLLETGKILGDISAPSIVLQKGVVVSGNFNITGGHKKDAKKVVEDSYHGGTSQAEAAEIRNIGSR